MSSTTEQDNNVYAEGTEPGKAALDTFRRIEKWIPNLLVVAEAVLCGLIIWKVNCVCDSTATAVSF